MEWLPAELRSFVSSAEEVFSQLGGASLSDVCTYRLYSDHGDDLERGLEDFAAVRAFVDARVKDFLWYREPFRLSMVVAPTKLQKQQQQSQQELKRAEAFYYHGSTRYGDCVDDEWFIVTLLLELTLKMPHLSCSISDSDGDFLLIEAAEHIPAGLNPENSSNRVWIRQGQVHIIPLDEAGKTPCGGMQLKSALECLRRDNGCGSSTVDSKVQSCIRARTLDVFPAYSVAVQHTAVCTLPRAVAFLLQHQLCRQLLSEIINAFCNSEATSNRAMAGRDGFKAKQLAALERLGPLIKGVGEQADLAVPTAVRFTRPLYARLSFQPFNTPQSLHDYHRRVTQQTQEAFAKLEPSAGGGRRLSAHSADLGCKILCGLELAYQSSKAAAAAAAEAAATAEEAEKGEEESKAKVDVEAILSSHGLVADSSLVNDAPITRRGVPMSEICVGESPQDHSHSTPPELHLLVDEILHAYREQECDSKDTGGTTAPRSDDEAWLHLTPDELDAEMLTRVARLRGSNAGENEQKQSQIAVPQSVSMLQKAAQERVAQSKDSMQRIVEGMDKFMSDESGLRGVKSRPATAATFNNPDSTTTTNKSSTAVGGLDVNLLRLEAILSKLACAEAEVDNDNAADFGSEDDDDDDDDDESDDDDNVSSTDSDDVQDDIARDKSALHSSSPPATSATVGRATFSMPNAERPEDEECSDSDDECDDGDPFDDDEYQAAMMDELMQTTLAESFERTPDGQDVDVERNLLAHLLESHASQMGASGPASVMLAQLGIKLPDPPSK